MAEWFGNRLNINKVILLAVFVLTCAGCASQGGGKFKFTPSGKLIGVGEKSQFDSDSELVGENCIIYLQDGTVLKGVVLEVSSMDISIGRDMDDSAIENASPFVVAVGKNEINFMTLTQDKTAGSSAGDMTVMLVMVPVALLIWFVSTSENPWQ